MPGGLFSDGQWVDALSGATYPTINPATEEPITPIAEARAEDVDRAVKAARKAFAEGAWSRLSAADRGRILWRMGDLLQKHLQEVAELETLAPAKTLTATTR